MKCVRYPVDVEKEKDEEEVEKSERSMQAVTKNKSNKILCGQLKTDKT